MRALAVDTSTATAGIAVADENGLLAGFMMKDMKTHSQKLVPMLKELLGSLRLDLSDIDVFAAVTGPGSFTGLRIGVTTIKTLAYALKKPVVGITSLDALANAAADLDDMLVCPIMDARNNQVYTAIYKPQNGLMINLSGYMGLHISELVKQFEEKYKGANPVCRRWNTSAQGFSENRTESDAVSCLFSRSADGGARCANGAHAVCQGRKYGLH